MSDLEEQAIRQDYRVIGEPSWQVQKRYHDGWKTVWYCSSEERAYRAIDKAVHRQLEWNRLTDEEKMAKILRGGVIHMNGRI